METHSCADRVNIGNANVYGLSTDLDLTGDMYNTALCVFFVPYIVFEIPSNVLLKRFRPHIWLSANMFLFGFTTMMQGVVKNYSGLLACRFFLGVFETGMFPGGKLPHLKPTCCVVVCRMANIYSLLSHWDVVQAPRGTKALLFLLQQHHPGRGFRWSARRCHRQHERPARL